MSLFDKTRSRKKKSTRQLIGTKAMSDYGIETYGQGELVYFIIKPLNIAVLPEETINYKLHALTTVLKSIGTIEWCCQNSRESYESNKEFLNVCIERESCEAVRKLCAMDIEFLDKIQTQMATAREFTLALRFKNHKSNELFQQVNRLEKLLKEQGFDARRADKEDLKRMLAVYLEQNITHMDFDEVDGVRFLERGNVNVI